MADRIYAAVNDVQAAAGQPAVDCAAAQPEVDELMARNHAVLALGKAGDLPISIARLPGDTYLMP